MESDFFMNFDLGDNNIKRVKVRFFSQQGFFICIFIFIFFLASGSVRTVKRHFPYTENEYYVTEFEEDIPVGNYSFTITFNSNVSETLTGFYKSNYKLNGVNK